MKFRSFLTEPTVETGLRRRANWQRSTEELVRRKTHRTQVACTELRSRHWEQGPPHAKLCRGQTAGGTQQGVTAKLTRQTKGANPAAGQSRGNADLRARRTQGKKL